MNNAILTTLRRLFARLLQVVLLTVFLSFSATYASGNPIGKILLVKGVATALTNDGELRTLAKSSDVFLAEKIETAADSFIVIKMSDGSKLTLRPNSELLLEAFNETAGQEKATFGLLKGGLRTLTGAIGKNKPEDFKIQTAVATIGVRGTDFIVRNCAADCVEEEEALRSFQRVPSAPVGGSDSTKNKKLLQLDSNNKVVGRTSLDCKPVVEIQRGLYVAVLEGKIYARQEDQEIELEAVEAAFLDDKEVICLGDIPNFIMLDDYLSNDPEGTVSLYNFLQFVNDEDQRCEVPEA